MTAGVLRPSRRRNRNRWAVGLVLLGAGLAVSVVGLWYVGVPLALLALAALVTAAAISFRPPAYELHIDDHGFRVYDLRGRATHDVAWGELRELKSVGGSVAWVCEPRRPKHGRVRWVRGLPGDDGCLPDTYDLPPGELMQLLASYAPGR